MTTKALNNVKKIANAEDLFESTRSFKDVAIPWEDSFTNQEGICRVDWELFIGISKTGISYIRAEHRYIKDLVLNGEVYDFKSLWIQDVVEGSISSLEPIEIEINSNLKTAVIYYGNKKS